MLKNYYLLEPNKSLNTKCDIENYCMDFFQNLKHKVKILDKSSTFKIYIKVDNTKYSVQQRVLNAKSYQSKLPISDNFTPILGAQQLIIEKI